MVVERLVAGGTAAAAVGGVKLLRLVDEVESLQFSGQNLFYLVSWQSGTLFEKAEEVPW